MPKFFPVFLSVAAVLALAPANASRVSGTAWNLVGEDEVEEEPVSRLSPIMELWQILPSELADELQEIRASVEVEFRAAMVATGEAEPDWKTKGVDLVGHMESLPGGIDNNALLAAGESPSLQFFGKIPADILADWTFIQAGSKAVDPTEAEGGIFLAIGPNHVVFVADDELQLGNARCMKAPIERAADHVTLYRYSSAPFDPDSDASLEAESEAIVMYNLIGGVRSPIFCSIFQRDHEGHYRNLSYTPDGRPLANMDDQNDQLKIVSSFDLYQQLNANYTNGIADDEMSNPAEEATDAS